MTMNSEHKILP